MEANYETVGYLSTLMPPDKRKEALRRSLLVLEKYDYDTIAVRGVSGLLAGTLIADATGKHLIVVRKGEATHSMNQVEGNQTSEKYIIVDDIVDTGKTANHIMQRVKNFSLTNPTCLGVLEVNRLHWYGEFTDDTFRERPLRKPIIDAEGNAQF